MQFKLQNSHVDVFACQFWELQDSKPRINLLCLRDQLEEEENQLPNFKFSRGEI